ncbi:MAG: hypothetical protein ACXWWD_08405, partial [Chitinophagaceae bacterium]
CDAQAMTIDVNFKSDELIINFIVPVILITYRIRLIEHNSKHIAYLYLSSLCDYAVKQRSKFTLPQCPLPIA